MAGSGRDVPPFWRQTDFATRRLLGHRLSRKATPGGRSISGDCPGAGHDHPDRGHRNRRNGGGSELRDPVLYALGLSMRKATLGPVLDWPVFLHASREACRDVVHRAEGHFIDRRGYGRFQTGCTGVAGHQGEVGAPGLFTRAVTPLSHIEMHGIRYDSGHTPVLGRPALERLRLTERPGSSCSPPEGDSPRRPRISGNVSRDRN